MESVDLDMDDLFDGGVEDDGEFPQPPAMNELEHENTSEQGDTEELSASVLDKLKNIKGAAKKVVKRPQPKLDSARLTGERGIPIIPKIFKDIKVKGQGHERDDLKTMMAVLEHWAHRLFPKMPFDEVLERIEKLGKKKEVQTCINKIRLDMPLLDEDFITDERDQSDEEMSMDKTNEDDEQLFDEILRQEEEARKARRQRDEENNLMCDMTSTPASHITSHQLTPEQMDRMERNKQLALQKKALRLGKQSTTCTEHRLHDLGELGQPASDCSQYDNGDSASSGAEITTNTQTHMEVESEKTEDKVSQSLSQNDNDDGQQM